MVKIDAGAVQNIVPKAEKFLQNPIHKGCNCVEDTITLTTKKIEIEDSFFDFLPWKKGYKCLPQTVQPEGYPQEAKRVTEVFDKNYRVDEKLPDGFRMSCSDLDHLDEAGNAIWDIDAPIADLEIMLVDRNIDKGLNTTIKKFRQLLAENPNASEYQKALLLKDFVNGCYSLSREHWTDMFTPRNFIKLGQTVKSGAGVCRHKSLLAKVLGDETGLNVSLIRGRYNIDGGLCGHMWNEIKIGEDSYMLDIMQDRLIKLNSKSDFLNKYHYSDCKNFQRKQMYV